MLRFYGNGLSFGRNLLALGCCMVWLAGCSSDDGKDKISEKPVEELYSDANKAFADGDYKIAAKNFEEVERQYPYSQWATRAQLMAAYAEYQGRDYDSAVATLDRFIQLHPGNKEAAYAYYMRAICFYERITDISRDQSITHEAEKALQDVVSRFPDSSYARDAEAKLSLVQDQLAGAEMEVGRFYLKRHVFTAALPRFQTVIAQYQTTSQVPEALHRIVECTLALGLKQEAQATAAVLGHNFPGSEWYQKSYDLLGGENLTPKADSESWVGKAWHTLF